MRRAMPLHRVVVIEDEPAIRRGVADALRATGYEVAEAADGARGLEEAVRRGVDLVLLDLLLPRRDGLDVLTQLRKVRPTLPVIILTARGSEDDRVRGLKMGADDYVVKPFSARELLARVEAVLRRSLGRPGGGARARLGPGAGGAGDAHGGHAHRPAADQVARPVRAEDARGGPDGAGARLHGGAG